jgi:hypothetical protein
MVAPTAAVLCGLIIALHLLPHRAEVSQCAVSDFEGALARFSSALRAQTISGDVSKASEWQQLHSLISRSYPATRSTLTVERVSRDSLLLTWPGTDRELAPVLFLSHFDVVPVTDDVSWTHPPFSGAIADGYVWGRGAIDLKVTAVSLLEAVEELVKAAQFTPRRTIAIAIGHDEESRSGEGAGGAAAACCSTAGGAGRWQHAPPAQPLATPAQRKPLARPAMPRRPGAMAELLWQRYGELEVVVDEGGIIVADGYQPLTRDPLALVMTSEKAYVTAKVGAARSWGPQRAAAPAAAGAGR